MTKDEEKYDYQQRIKELQFEVKWIQQQLNNRYDDIEQKEQYIKTLEQKIQKLNDRIKQLQIYERIVNAFEEFVHFIIQKRGMYPSPYNPYVPYPHMYNYTQSIWRDQ